MLYERDQLWKRLGEKPAKRLHELEKYPEMVRQRDDLSVETRRKILYDNARRMYEPSAPRLSGVR